MVIFHGYVSLPEGNHNYHNWLVVWNMNFIFPSIGNNDPNRRTHICQRGGSTTNQFIIHPDVQIKQKLRFFGCFGWHVRQPVGWWKWCETPPDFQGFRDAACWCWKPFLIEDVEPFHFWGPTPHLQTFAGRFLMFIFYGRPFFSWVGQHRCLEPAWQAKNPGHWPAVWDVQGSIGMTISQRVPMWDWDRWNVWDVNIGGVRVWRCLEPFP